MDRKWLLIGAVVIMLALAGCVGDGGSDTPDGETEDGGENSTGTDDGSADDDGMTGSGEDGGTTGDGSGTDTGSSGQRLTSCNEGESYTETYTSTTPGPSGDTQTEEVTVTVTVEGTENRDGTEYCGFSANYDNADMGMEQMFEGNPEMEGRTAEEVRWLVPTENLDGSFNATGERVILEVYDTNGNIMMSWQMSEGITGMSIYDENGNEIDTGMGGMGGGQMPSGGQGMPSGR